MCRSPCCSKKGLNRGRWSVKEDMILSEYVLIHGDGEWSKIPEKAALKRCGKSCRLRWTNYLRPGIKRGSISLDEEELIFRLHRLLGNRWSLIAGRLPGRTDNEIKNYWNTCLSKKLLLDESQPKRMSRSPSPIRNHVLIKTTPRRIITAVKHAGILNANDYSNRLSSDKALKLCTIEQNATSSNLGCNVLVNDSERSAFAMTDVTDQVRNSATCYMSSFVDQQCPHVDNSAAHGATLAGNLFDLQEALSPHCNLLSSPSSFWTESGLEQFGMRRATSVGAETIAFEDTCSDTCSDQRMEEFYGNSQQVDWIW